jgi:hypothetical protein
LRDAAGGSLKRGEPDVGEGVELVVDRGRHAMDHGTLTPRERGTVPRSKELRRELILNLRNRLIDADIVVDDARQELERAIRSVRDAVQARDRLARKLKGAIAALEAAA